MLRSADWSVTEESEYTSTPPTAKVEAATRYAVLNLPHRR